MKTVQLEEYVQKHDQLEEGYANMDQLEDQPLPEKRILLLLVQFEVTAIFSIFDTNTQSSIGSTRSSNSMAVALVKKLGLK